MLNEQENVKFDREMSFVSEHCGKRDYLVRGNPHTSPGRMGAYCPHDPQFRWYNVSLRDLHEPTPAAAWWSSGFVAGNEPGPPVDSDGLEYEAGTEAYDEWNKARDGYLKRGYWPDGTPSALSGPWA